MTKMDIVKKITSTFPYISKKKAILIVDLILEKIVETIRSGRRAEFRGFGSFKQRIRNPYRAKAVNGSDIVLFKRRVLPYFRPSPYLNDVINGRIKREIKGKSKAEEGVILQEGV